MVLRLLKTSIQRRLLGRDTLTKEAVMALQGYRSSEDRRSRLTETAWGLVTLFRVSIGSETYEIFKEGVKLGSVTRQRKKWFVDGTQILHTTRKEAVREAITLFYTRAKRERDVQHANG